MKKNKMTPAQVAEQLGQFIAKQEETLLRYPVGPIGNTAKLNLRKGREALEALQGKNEEMRIAAQPQGQPALLPEQMALGGGTGEFGVEETATGTGSPYGLTSSQQAMLNVLVSDYGMSPAIAAAAVAVTQKESRGSAVSVENNYSGTSNAGIRAVNTRFARKFKDMPDEELNRLKADPEAFFNYVYNDATGNSAEGDGYKYRGRGLVQVTGRGNYERVSQAIFGDNSLVDNPDLLLDPATAGAAAAYFLAESGKGVKGYVDFDLSTPDPTPEQIQQVLNGSYAVVASGGTLSKSVAQDSEQMAELYGQFNTGMPKMQAFAGVDITALPKTKLASVEDPQIEADRRTSAVAADTVKMLQDEMLPFQVPQEAAMTASGDSRGYLGGTYAADATGTQGFNPVSPEDAAFYAQRQQEQEQFNALPKDVQGKINNDGLLARLAPDFSYEDVLNWGEENYGVSEGRGNSRNLEGTDNTIIGNNLYRETEGTMIFTDDKAFAANGGTGVSVDETRILLQSLKNNGLTTEQAFDALSDPETYRDAKQNIPKTGLKRGVRTPEQYEQTFINANEWGKTEPVRNGWLNVVPGLRDDDQFTTKLAPGINPDIPIWQALQDEDRARFLKNNPGGFYTPGAGGANPADVKMPRHAYAQNGRQISQKAAGYANNQFALDTRQMPSFLPESPTGEAGQGVQAEQVLSTPSGQIPGDPSKDGGTGGSGGQGAAPANPEVSTGWGREKLGLDLKPDEINLNLPKPNLLQAVPAMAAAASAGIQRNALNQMQGPQRPIETDIPQFAYESNIQATLDDIRNATNTAARGSEMPSQQAAANKQALMATRFREEGNVRNADNRQKQQQLAQYNLYANHARTAQNALRTQYQEDAVNFSNQKKMLDAQIKQYPLNVLASTTQDYLKNVYQPNMAALIEAQGRQYETKT